MKYVFIENHRAEFSIKAMCRVLRVARSGWYVWLRRRHQMSLRQQFRLTCDAAVHKAFFEAKQRYGAPRLADELPEFNIKTIAASLRRQGLRAKASRKFSPVSYRAHGLPVLENLLEQDFSASGPNQKWAGDISNMLKFRFTCNLYTGNASAAAIFFVYVGLILSSVITIAGVVTLPVAVSARNNLKTIISLRAVSTLRG